MATARTRRATVATVVLVLLSVLAPGIDSVGAVTSTPPLLLEAQSPDVTSPSSTSTSSMWFRFDTSNLDAASTTVSVAIYPSLYSRLQLQQDIAQAPTGVGLASTNPLALSCLTTAGTSARVAIALTAPGGPRPNRVLPGCGGAPAPVLDLGCSGSGCNGVYPVTVTVDRNQSVLERICTFVTLTASASTNPLRVALVLPISSGGAGTAALGRASVEGVVDALGVLDQAASVPVTVAPVPATLAATARTSSASTLSDALRRYVAQRGHEVLAQPYVRIDPGSLNAAGLSAEVANQRAAGATAVRAEGLNVGAVSTYLEPDTGWVPSAAGIVAGGGHGVVVDAAALVPQPFDGFSWGQPFNLSDPSGTTVLAAASDPGLEAHFTSSTTDPALGAYQLLGDLSLLYDEEPGLSTPRGVVVAAPTSWQLDATFLSALTGGLSANPVLRPITLDGYFSSVPVGGNGAPSTRSGTEGGQSSFTPMNIRALRDARQRYGSLQPSLAGDPSSEFALEQPLLGSQALGLGALGARAKLTSFAAAQRHLLNQVSIVEDPITLTSQRGSLPITILSSTPGPLSGVLRLSSPRIDFPHGQAIPLVLGGATTTVRIDVAAQTTGDLPLEISFTTTDGQVVFASGSIVVRSTATSVVGLALTIAAAGVLGVWWLRTWRRNRAARQANRG